MQKFFNPNSNGHPATLNTDGILNILSTKTWTNTPKVVREAYQYDAKHLPPPPRDLTSVPCTMKTHTGAKNHACIFAAIVRLTDDLRFFKKYHWIGNFNLILKMGFKLKIKQKMTKLWVPKKG